MQHPVIEGVTARTEYIATLMEQDRWHTRRTKRELAATWGVSESAIQNYSAEAGRSLEAGLKEDRAARAYRAAERLERIAVSCADSTIPGDAGAAVRANEVLLKMTGFSEPEEDKQRPTTVVMVGQVATSPAMSALVAGRKLNGHNDQARTEVVDELPAADRDRELVPRRGNGSSVD